ncbi:Crp/Fnr family transcriptional regulator [Candidatus Woesearchaeota archaeon]|nr:Crp/Fnr family transcriptional regulator [Candidatus Woesearchaeota archaeon]
MQIVDYFRQKGTPVNYLPHDVLRDSDQSIQFIVQGSVTYEYLHNGSQVEMGHSIQGEVLGLESLTEDCMGPSLTLAKGYTTALKISKPNEEDIRFLHAMYQKPVHPLIDARNHLRMRAAQNSRDKILYFLDDLLKRSTERYMSIRYSNQAIGDYINMSMEQVSRTLHPLIKNGSVRRQRNLTILDREMLSLEAPRVNIMFEWEDDLARSVDRLSAHEQKLFGRHLLRRMSLTEGNYTERIAKALHLLILDDEAPLGIPPKRVCGPLMTQSEYEDQIGELDDHGMLKMIFGRPFVYDVKKLRDARSKDNRVLDHLKYLDEQRSSGNNIPVYMLKAQIGKLAFSNGSSLSRSIPTLEEQGLEFMHDRILLKDRNRFLEYIQGIQTEF